MTPVNPELTEPHQFIVFATDQPEYLPLPAALVVRENSTAAVTRWQFSDEERAQIANGADLFLEILTFGQPLQPVLLRVGDAPEGE